jgi:hypothetical protein
MKDENTERVESLVDLSALAWFKESTNIIIVDMMNEGWEYTDVREYLFDRIEENIIAHKRQNIMREFDLVLGRSCVVIDECKKQNNVDIYTIIGGENGGICFEGKDGETYFASELDRELFVTGYKAWIHPGEVSIQLVG